MPDASHPLVARFDAAVAAVEARWEELDLRPRKLHRRELAAYRGRAAEMGWRFAADFPGGLRRLDVIVTAAFPSTPARIALVDRPPFLTWPHVEKDGVLCLFPNTTTMSVDEPYDGVAALLKEAFAMVGAAIRGELDGDFRTEFLTYWHHAERGDRNVLSLLDPGPPSRRVRVWQGVNQTIVAESDEQLRTWLQNAAPKVAASKIKSLSGAFVWLDRVPTPAEYPSLANDVCALAERNGGTDLLDELAREALPHTFVLFGALAEAGPALATAVVNRPAVVRGRDPLSAGFRPSAVPEHVVTGRSAADRRARCQRRPRRTDNVTELPNLKSRRRSVSSAGILMYRRAGANLEVLLVHPGGPYWRKRDEGAWSIPKGEMDEEEDAEVAARREFMEETGIALSGLLDPLGDIRQRGGKRVIAFAVEGDVDVQTMQSNTFEIEWPPKSGRMQGTRPAL